MNDNIGYNVFQKCVSDVNHFVVNIPSQSSSDVEYSIVGSFEKGSVRCSCPGFNFKGECAHLRIIRDRCKWNSRDSNIKQTTEQRESNICPICGNRTIISADIHDF